MNQLFTLVDGHRRELPYMEHASYINYYGTPDGSAKPVPVDAKFIGVSTTNQNAWFELGTSSSVTAADSTAGASDITDGTSSMLIHSGSRYVTRIGDSNDYFAVLSTGDVVVEFWQ